MVKQQRFLPVLCLLFATTFSMPILAQPANDDCTGAIPIDVGDTPIDTTSATSSGLAGGGCGGGSGGAWNDIWFSYTAPDNGNLSLSTCDQATFDSDLVIYDGDCSSLNEVGCNGDGTDPNTGVACTGFTSYADMIVVAGVTYLVRVGGWADGDVGTGTLTLAFTSATLPVQTLDCILDPIDNTVAMTWANSDAYDEINIYLNGTLEAALPGSDASYTSGALGFGASQFCVEAILGGVLSQQVCCTVVILEPCPAADGIISDFPAPPVADGGSVSCGAGGFHAENHFWKKWNLNGQVGASNIELTCVEIGVNASAPGAGPTQPMAINVYLDEDGTQWPTVTSMTLIATYDFGLPGGIDNEVYPVIFPTPISIPCSSITGANATLVIDVMCYDLNQQDAFWMGTQDVATGAQAQPSFLSAAACGIPNPIDVAAIGFGDLQWVIEAHFNLLGTTCGGAAGLANFQCNNTDADTAVEVSWDAPASTPDSYDVYVDAALVANIPGTDNFYFTPGLTPYQQHTITVQEIIGGFAISDTNCSINVNPTNDTYDGAEPISVGTVPFQCDPTFNGTDSPEIDVAVCDFGFGVQQQYNDIFFCYTATSTGPVIVTTCGATGDTNLSVYNNGCADDDPANVIACNDDATSGLCGVAAELIFDAVNGVSYMIRLGTFNPAGLASGDLTINDCVPPTNIAVDSDCNSGDVTLTWDAGTNWSSLEVTRDGGTIATLAVTDTSYVDAAVANGDHVYEVVADCGSGPNPTTVNTSVLTYAGQTDLIFAVEGLQTAGDLGAIDSGAALLLALTDAGRDAALLRMSPVDYACVTDADIANIWMMTGTVPTDYRINQAEGDLLGTLGNDGKGIYFEGGDHFGWQHQASLFDSRDGVDDGTYNTGDGDDLFTAMDGLNAGNLDTSDQVDVIYNQDNIGGNDWTDWLTPATTDAFGPNAAPAWKYAVSLGTPEYFTTVYYDTDSGGKTISSSWEFGGYGGDQVDLAGRYAVAFGGTEPEFRRGDSNGDSAFNIADPVHSLANLFSGGAIPGCMDAADSNDDGSFNIADPVKSLGTLFSMQPPPPAPGPTNCGPDPTDDTLECLEYNAC